MLVIAEYGEQKRQHVICGIPFFTGDAQTVRALLSSAGERGFFQGIRDVLRKIAIEQNASLPDEQKTEHKINVKLGAYHIQKKTTKPSGIEGDKTIMDYISSKLIHKPTLYAIVNTSNRTAGVYRLPTRTVRPPYPFDKTHGYEAYKKYANALHASWIKRNTRPFIMDKELPSKERDILNEFKKRVAKVRWTQET